MDLEHLDALLQGWINHVSYVDTWGLRRALFAAHPIPRPDPAAGGNPGEVVPE